ncbi:KCTD7-like protein [Mya arenaria]|uniref:KCTD7-like protein n=1 Tax=Mya arenaria TaxID=6604 RepID=A0ABY7DRX7_MYAAR|nr:KCTD7-like protein [Mya arenaria]
MSATSAVMSWQPIRSSTASSLSLMEAGLQRGAHNHWRNRRLPGDFPPIIELNVGGRFFTTTHLTLTKCPDNMLSAMFSGKYSVIRDKDGRYFIDADGDNFIHILNYLRYGDIPSQRIAEAVYREATYFGIHGLVDELEKYPQILAKIQRNNYRNQFPGFGDCLDTVINVSSQTASSETTESLITNLRVPSSPAAAGPVRAANSHNGPFGTASVTIDGSSWTVLPTNELLLKLISVLCGAMRRTVEKQLVDFLDGGRYAGTPSKSDLQSTHFSHVTNLGCEHHFGDLDSSQRRRPNASFHHNSSVQLIKRNRRQLFKWLDEKPDNEKATLMKAARSGGRDLRKAHMAEES